MKIFFAVPRSAWVDLNLRRSLEDLGHQLVRFDFPGWPDDADPAWRTTGKPRTNQRLLERVRAARQQGGFDLFFGYFYSSVVYPETIDLIRASGVPTVNFSCNNVHQFDLVRDIAPHFDVCMVPELAAQADFRQAGARPVRIQLAANPRVYRPYPEPRVYDVTFVGQRYADRAELMQHLASNGVSVRAWGAGWDPARRLDAAHARAALALIEDERLDGVRRLVHQRVQRLARRARRPGSHAPSAEPVASPSAGALASATLEPGRGSLGQLASEAQATSGCLRQTRSEAHAATGSSSQGASEVQSPSGPLSQPASEAHAPDDSWSPRPSEAQAAISSLSLATTAFGGPRLLHTELIRMFSRSRLSLGFATAGDSHLHATRLTHLRLREFEAPMSGALYLTEDQPELAEYFEPGRELLTYTDPTDLLDKARYYLAHQEQSERIRRAGLERARREHTWQHRFAQLFQVLGLPHAT